MVSGWCPACARGLGVIQVLLKFEAKLPLIFGAGKAHVLAVRIQCLYCHYGSPKSEFS